VALLATPAFPQDPDSIEDVFPASSWALVRFAGLAECARAADRLGLVRLGKASLDEAGPELRAAVESALQRDVPQWHRALEDAGLEPAVLRAVLANPIAAGVGRPTFFGGTPWPSVALALDVTGCDREAASLIEFVEQCVRQQTPDVERTTVEVHGTSMAFLAAPRRSGEVAHARSGRYLLLANCASYLRECLATCRGELPSYGDSAAYRESRERLPEAALVNGHLSLEPLWFTRPFLPYEVTDVFDALGLSALDGVSFALATDGGLDVAHLGIEGPDSGVLRSALGRPASLGAAALCPTDTLLYATLSIDTCGAMAAVRRVFDALPREFGSDLREQVARDLDQQLQGLGTGLDELCASIGLFGPELTIAVTSPGSSALQPELVAMVDVADAEAAQRLLAAALHRLGVSEGKETAYGETPIRYWNAFEGSPMPYRPAVAVHGGRLIAASSSRALKSALARAAGKSEGLDAEDDFAPIAASAQGASGLVVLRLNSAVPQLWSLAVPWLEKALAKLGDVDPDVLPTREQVSEAIGDGVVTFTVDGDGISLCSRQVLGPGALIAAAGALFDHALGLGPPKVH
jgi:hypothetical protein